MVLIWEIIADYFRQRGCPMDTVFFNNYELQVQSQLAGHVDIAWNSPLAWLDTVAQTDGGCRAIAMRDTDQDRVSHLSSTRTGASRLSTTFAAVAWVWAPGTARRPR